MKLFERKIEVNETYPQECDIIWDYLNEKGTPLFKRNKLEDYWRDFSACYEAGFLIPDTLWMESFLEWLENYD